MGGILVHNLPDAFPRHGACCGIHYGGAYDRSEQLGYAAGLYVHENAELRRGFGYALELLCRYRSYYGDCYRHLRQILYEALGIGGRGAYDQK